MRERDRFRVLASKLDMVTLSCPREVLLERQSVRVRAELSFCCVIVLLTKAHPLAVLAVPISYWCLQAESDRVLANMIDAIILVVHKTCSWRGSACMSENRVERLLCSFLLFCYPGAATDSSCCEDDILVLARLSA